MQKRSTLKHSIAESHLARLKLHLLQYLAVGLLNVDEHEILVHFGDGGIGKLDQALRTDVMVVSARDGLNRWWNARQALAMVPRCMYRRQSG